MSGYFNFGWQSSGAEQLDFRFLFKAHGPINHAELGREIKVSVQRVPYPDVIVIICSEAEFEAVVKAFDDPTVQVATRRLSSRTQLYIVSFDTQGEFVHSRRILCVGGPEGRTELIKASFEDIKRKGIEELFTSNSVVIPAPSGFRFRKPSNDYSSHFIRTEEALGNSENVEFLAFCLLRRVAERSAPEKLLETIFVDSMAISSVAYALRQMLERNNQSPRIESFHSHEGLKSITAPVPDKAFCIISASSSMSLQRKWKEHVGCSDQDVVTLVTLDSAVDSRNALFAHVQPPDWKSGDDESAGLQDLQIIGERFQPQQMPIKKVKITKTEHRPQAACALADEFHGVGLAKVYSRDGEKIRPLLIDGNKLIDGSDFQGWLYQNMSSPNLDSVQAIICQGDPASRSLAELCKAKLAALGKPIKDRIMTDSELELPGLVFDNESALLIVGAVVSRGTKLQSIARDLRDKHVGPKTYLLGMQLAQTQEEITFLETSLKQAKTGKNPVHVYRAISTGRALKSSFDEEAKIYRENVPLSALSGKRAGIFSSNTDAAPELSLLPDHLGQPMQLRKDFVYWGTSYVPGSEHAPLVLLTIGAVLQLAREGKFKNSEHWLKSNAIQQVVLQPLLFMRFNDGIIQAAILRQSYPSELDYSSLPEESRLMRTILEGQILYRTRPQGEAALEFALALRTGKLKLTKADHDEFIQFARKHLKGSEQDVLLLQLLDPNMPQGEEDL